VLSDCWRPEQRGRSFAIPTFVPLLGPAIGPITGGLISQGAGWPWIFWAMSIYDALLIIWAIFFFRETYAPAILYEKSKRLRKNSNRGYHTEFEQSNPKLLKPSASA
jgi:MFS family permease